MFWPLWDSQRRLRASELRYRRLFEAARDGILILNPENRTITDVNPFMSELLGYTRQEFIGKELWEIGLLTDAEASQRAFRELQQEGYIRYEDLPLQTKLGKRREVEFVSNVYTENGHQVIQCNIRDITDRKKQLPAKPSIRDHLRIVCESIPEKIFTAKRDGQVDYLNQNWTTFAGLSSDWIEDWEWTRFIHPDDKEQTIQLWQHSVATGQPFQTEHRLRGRDGVYRWHLSRAHVVGDIQSEVNMWIGSNTDIDDQKRSEEELQQSLLKERKSRVEADANNQAKDEFLATVSHELRTPLNAIVGWATLLRSGKLTNSQSVHGLEVIERSAKVQEYLIEDIVDISRIISGKLRLDIQTMPLLSVVSNAVDSMSIAADTKGVEIRAQLDPDPCLISGDRERLSQAVTNVLSNAIKFTPAGGRVDVCLDRVGSHAVITVSDTGAGISASVLPFIFDRFKQSDVASRRKHSGLGLGLTIARTVVEMHDGTIFAESGGEGYGSSFTIKIPLKSASLPLSRAMMAQDARTSTAQAKSIFDLRAIDACRIEVVDDDFDNSEMIKAILEQGGAEVRSANSAMKGLALFEEWRPDLLICDLAMPEKDGYWLIKQVRALEQALGKSIPSVALTAYVGSEDQMRVLLAGFDRYMPKPIERDELLSVVASLVEPKGRS